MKRFLLSGVVLGCLLLPGGAAVSTYDSASPRSGKFVPVAVSGLRAGLRAQENAGCTGKEPKPTKWCPDPLWGPCTAYECKSTSKPGKSCKEGGYPVGDPCFGCTDASSGDCTLIQ